MTNNAYRAVLLLPPLLVGLAGLGAHNVWFVASAVVWVIGWCVLTNGEDWG